MYIYIYIDELGCVVLVVVVVVMMVKRGECSSGGVGAIFVRVTTMPYTFFQNSPKNVSYFWHIKMNKKMKCSCSNENGSNDF